MHHEPYYSHYRRITELDFLNFVQFQIEDYENVITLWNEKNRSYLEMKELLPYALAIRIEDFHSDQFHVFNQVSEEIQFNGKFMPIHSYVGGRGYTEEKDVSKSLKLPHLSKLEIETINDYLDKDLMERLNYNLLP